MYYVYEWYVAQTDEIFYVGKGCNNRYKNYWDRNNIFKDYYQKYDCRSRIVKEFNNEKDAYEYEKFYIDELKKINMCKANIHIGGAGGSGELWTEELRKDYSENNIMKHPEQRKRMSQNNPMKNPNITKVVAMKKSRKVIIGSIEYNSVKDAMNQYNVCYDTIASWCNKGINYYGEKCRFKDTEQVDFVDNRYNKGGCKSLTYNNKTYESAVDLANELNCSTSRVYSWLKRGFDINGNPCRYDDDDRELTYVNKYKIRKRNAPIIINDIHYDSIADASEKLNISKGRIRGYLRGDYYNPNYICAYDNQQPSRGNSSKSTSEGSTTNG